MKVLSLCAMLLAALAAPTSAQDFRGRINGTVTDNTGAVLPGVTVTATSPALIQPQVQVTAAAGEYRFLALPPGVYEVQFELAGFQTIKRDNIRVVINSTLTVDQQLQLATVQETVVVTGQSPVVDTSTTQLGTNFTKELLTEIPNARDVWAAMSQAPGMQMTAFDVGGSNTGNQSGYRTYGMDTQNQTKLEGIDTTETVNANAGYFDFGSFEEFQVGGAGSDASTYAGGAVLSISVKAGGDRFAGTWYSDYVSESQLTDNVPSYLKTANTPNEDGMFSRLPTGLCFDRLGETICRGNAVKKQYDINGDIGGPLWKGKAWFFFSSRLNDKYAYITGLGDTTERSKLSNKYTFKGTFQLNRNNQVIGFLNKREKLQDKRGISLTTPLSAAYYQSSRNYPWKWEWTSVLGSRAFLDVLAGNWYNFFPLRPVRDFGLYDGPWTPPRQNTASSVWSNTGGNNGYQDQKRYKPQVYATLSYFKDGWMGSHDFRVGYDWKRDRRSLFNDQPFDIWYRDTTVTVDGQPIETTSQVDLFNSSVTGINDVVYTSVWANDTWKMNNRLTLNWGLRFEAYKDQWPEQSLTPNGHPALAGWTDARYQAFIAPRTVEARTVADTKTIVPRIGFAYDLTGDNKSVVKGFFGITRWNSADQIADNENPVGLAQLRYAFVPCSATVTTGCDLNGNRLVDSPAELGAWQQNLGGGGSVRVDRDMVRPTTSEVSLNFERELKTGFSGRASYVYKNMRNVWGELDVIREAGYTVPFTITDPGTNLTSTADDRTFSTFALPLGIGTDRVFTNLGERGNADFQNIEFGVNRRFAGKWMLLASYGMTWSTMAHTAAAARYGNTTFPYRPFDRLWGDDGVETTSLWNYKIVGRYVMPYAIGVSGSWKVQSGFNFARTISVSMPVEGNRTIRVEPIDAHRYPSVAILDFRVDRTFNFGKAGKLTPMLDIFNLANSGVPTTVRTTNTATAPFNDVTAILNPRVIRFGFRYNF